MSRRVFQKHKKNIVKENLSSRVLDSAERRTELRQWSLVEFQKARHAPDVYVGAQDTGAASRSATNRTFLKSEKSNKL